MKTIIQRFIRVAESLGLGILFLITFAPMYSFAQSREADAARSVNALLNFATRSDPEDRNRNSERERFTLPDHASPVAHAVLSAIAQTAGSADTINHGQRAQAIHEAMSEVINPQEIAANVIHEDKHEDKDFKDAAKDIKRAEKITNEIAKAIENKLSTQSDFKVASVEQKKDLIEREREQKFEEKFESQEHNDRADLLSQVTNFNDGKESKSKELERLASNKSENGRSGASENKASEGSSKKDDTSVSAKAETKAETKADSGSSDSGKSDSGSSGSDKDKDKK